MQLRFAWLALVALVALAAHPAAVRADARLLDGDLRAPDLRVLALLAPGDPPQGQGSGAQGGDGSASGGKKDATAPESPLDFDLLGEAKPPPPSPDDAAMARRRKMLGVHQNVGLFALVPLQVATTVVGQLNYNDKFGDANTNKYKQTHQVLAYSTLAVFAANGLLALLAPEPASMPHRGVDRVTLHKIAMFTAAVGMAAQAGLGIYTAQREGYENKQEYGNAHLVVGYVTLAAVLAGVSAIVF